MAGWQVKAVRTIPWIYNFRVLDMNFRHKLLKGDQTRLFKVYARQWYKEICNDLIDKIFVQRNKFEWAY